MKPHSAPPRDWKRGQARRLLRLDTTSVKGLKLRNSGFWAGWGGLITTIGTGLIVVALLVGWVLIWANREGTPRVVFLVLGSVAFAIVLASLFTLLNRLQAHARLRQVEAAFLAGTSHGLRTPLAGIRASAQALQRHELTPSEKSRLIQALEQEAQRLNLRIDNILETNRLMLERASFIPERVFLYDFITRLLQNYENEIQARNGSIKLNLPADLQVRADPRGLELVFENMIDNAVKYSDEKPEIEINGQETQGFVLVQIRDQGRGFHQEDATQFFKRFTRGDRGSKGVGLGLALAQAVVHGHGGSLHLHSDGPGQGATAEIWLPCVKNKEQTGASDV